MGLSPKRECCLKQKNPLRRLFRTYGNLAYLLEGVWMVLMNKNGDTTEARAPIVPIVKCGETPSECVEEGELVKISWDSPCAMVQ